MHRPSLLPAPKMPAAVRALVGTRGRSEGGGGQGGCLRGGGGGVRGCGGGGGGSVTSDQLVMRPR